MKVAVACDHGGYALKSIVLQTIQEEGHEALDLGTFGLDSVDFPDFAEKAGERAEYYFEEMQRGF